VIESSADPHDRFAVRSSPPISFRSARIA